MSVRNAGKAIREARLKAGLTQEKLSDGICSTLSLSRIENCTAGVSPSTFHALMSRAGAECEAFPTFASRTDFDCFYTLKRARFYLEAWQFEDAYHQLMSVQDMNWADNRFYYQEWLLLQYRIQFHNHSQEHEYLYDLLTEAFLISYPEFNIDMINSLLLSTVELEILIGLAQECYYLGQTDRCGYLCAQIESYLQNSQFTTLEKERLLAQNAIVYTKYLLAKKDYVNALEVADRNRHQMVMNCRPTLLYELTFLTALGYYYNNDSNAFYKFFQAAFYSSHAIGSCYSTYIKQFVLKNLQYNLDEQLLQLSDISFSNFELKKIEDLSSLHDGIFDSCSTTIIYLGDLIHSLRTEQKISQQLLCQGLCSKSKLSKIENNYLQPNISLAEALLQRLGYSERVFTFWGTEDENSFHELKTQIIHEHPNDNISVQEKLTQLAKFISPQNSLEEQFYIYQQAIYETNIKKKIELLESALHITLPNFSFLYINNYRYTWAEISIIQSLCWAYSHSEEFHIGLKYYYFVLEYIKNNTSDIILQSCTFQIAISFFADRLGTFERHKELVFSLAPMFKSSFMKHSIQYLGICYFYYCQSLGECHDFKKMIPYAHYACGINDLMELNTNSSTLKKYLNDTFKLTIN